MYVVSITDFRERLEIVFSTFKKPDIFQSDNGTEFKNALIKNYLKNNRIEYINGGVRHPQSQRVVEKINDFLVKPLKTSLKIVILKKKRVISYKNNIGEN